MSSGAASRPRILISRAETIAHERWDDYADRIAEAGGQPIAIELADWREHAPYPPHDGILLTGGVDIDPARYGEPRSERVRETNPARDAFELVLIEAARTHQRPLLAICRGHQLFNVAHGGTLLQHLEQREPHRARRGADGETIVSGWHDVDIRSGTLLAELLAIGPAGARVHTNSRHHQAVTLDRVAPGLAVAATTDDGVVESLIDAAQPWALSVQWHAEMPECADAFRGLWTAFVHACAEAARQPERSARA